MTSPFLKLWQIADEIWQENKALSHSWQKGTKRQSIARIEKKVDELETHISTLRQEIDVLREVNDIKK